MKAHPTVLGVRWLVAAISINYLEEMHFPQPVTISSGFSALGNSSWTISSAAFQNGQCCATCDTVMVMHGTEGRRHITEEMRAQMRPFFVREAPSAFE